MKFPTQIVLSALFLAGCANNRPIAVEKCNRENSFTLGMRDGTSGRTPSYVFLNDCPPASRSSALSAYQEGFNAGRSRVKALKISPEQERFEENGANLRVGPLPAEPVRQPSNLSWVCEVEANSKIFTGVGLSREEALGSARATCGSHFEASYCEKADCKESL